MDMTQLGRTAAKKTGNVVADSAIKTGQFINATTDQAWHATGNLTSDLLLKTLHPPAPYGMTRTEFEIPVIVRIDTPIEIGIPRQKSQGTGITPETFPEQVTFSQKWKNYLPWPLKDAYTF